MRGGIKQKVELASNEMGNYTTRQDYKEFTMLTNVSHSTEHNSVVLVHIKAYNCKLGLCRDYSTQSHFFPDESHA
jgi:hypothetical protein